MTYFLEKNKEKVILFLAIVLFIFYKMPHLALPLFWDELGVYGKSVFSLLDHNIGFQPKYLEPELSRGHPMLYVFLTASFVNVFGSDFFTMRVFNLLISLTVLFSIFYIVKTIWSKRIALFTTLILITQPLFIAQSVLVLPEMMLSLFLIWSIYFFLKEKWILYFVVTSLAMMTKETAIFLPPVLGFVFFFWKLIFDKKLPFKKLLFIASPLLSFFGFLWLQKLQNGWYFFPYHDPFEGAKGFFDFDTIRLKATDFFDFIFKDQGRIFSFYFGLFSLVTTFFLWKRKNVYIFIVIFSAVLGLILFSSTSYYMTRYMLVGICLASILIAFLIGQIFKSKPIIQYLLVFAFMASSSSQTYSSIFKNDENMSYVKVIRYHKKIVSFMESRADWKSTIHISANFPIHLAFNDKRYGYCEKCLQEKSFYNIEKNTDYIIETNPGSWLNYQIPEGYVQIPFEPDGFNTVKIYRKLIAQ